MPIECLTFEEIPDQQRINSSFITHELTINLYKAKEAFLDSTATKVLIDYIKLLLRNVGSFVNYSTSHSGLFRSIKTNYLLFFPATVIIGRK